MLLRTVSSADFEHFKQNEITGSTESNDFKPINKDNSNHFEICLAGAEDKRLFYDEMFLNQETRHTDQTPCMLMKMRLVPNVRTNSLNMLVFLVIEERYNYNLKTIILGLAAQKLFLALRN